MGGQCRRCGAGEGGHPAHSVPLEAAVARTRADRCEVQHRVGWAAGWRAMHGGVAHGVAHARSILRDRYGGNRRALRPTHRPRRAAAAGSASARDRRFWALRPGPAPAAGRAAVDPHPAGGAGGGGRPRRRGQVRTVPPPCCCIPRTCLAYGLRSRARDTVRISWWGCRAGRLSSWGLPACSLEETRCAPPPPVHSLPMSAGVGRPSSRL